MTTEREFYCPHGRPVPTIYELPCGCGGTVVYEPVAHGMALARRLDDAVGALRAARFYVDARATGSTEAAKVLDRIDAVLGQ